MMVARGKVKMVRKIIQWYAVPFSREKKEKSFESTYPFMSRLTAAKMLKNMTNWVERRIA